MYSTWALQKIAKNVQKNNFWKKVMYILYIKSYE